MQLPPFNRARLPATMLSTPARLVFLMTLAPYYWVSAQTKLGDGFWGFLNPSDGAYYQIFPHAYEAAGFDKTAMALWQDLMVLAGTWGEFILPFLLIIGFMTRATAIGMIGFVIVQTVVDLFGHGAINDPVALGAFFDKNPSSLLTDQRLLWIMLLFVPVIHGGGIISVDRLICRSHWARHWVLRWAVR